MIEEIVKVIEKAESQCYPLTYCRRCKYQNIKGHCCFYNYAEKIEKAGYRHINEVRKETAKEIYKMLLGTEHIKVLEQKEHCDWWISRWCIEDLNRVFKEFGVEVEE